MASMLAVPRCLRAQLAPAARKLRSRCLSSAAGDAEKDRLVLFDTTLRDGEQEKLIIARHLSLMGVDVCEAGFPIASPGDFEAVAAIAKEIGPLTDGRSHGPMRICGLSRANEKDIDRCYQAVKHAPKHRIHTFLASSDIHLKYKLKISREQCIANSIDAVKFARSLVDSGDGDGDVEFSPEDAGRSDRDFLVELLSEVIKAGAGTLNIPDTVGYTLPDEYGDLFSYLIENTEGSDKVVWSTHCHNDLGLATGCTLAGVLGGARQVEVAINGIGERAGNTSLEEIIMAVATRPNQYPVQLDHVNPVGIMRASNLVKMHTGMQVQPNKAIVGANAFAHEAGIHQDGVLKHAQTYEIMTPESVGLSTNSLVLGKHSGRAAYRDRLEALGYTEQSTDDIDRITERCKEIADEKKVVTDDDISAIVSEQMSDDGEVHHRFELKSVNVTAGNLVKPTATVCLAYKDPSSGEVIEEINEVALGNGPIDAVYQAISRATSKKGVTTTTLKDFEIQGVRDGSAKALGVVNVRLEPMVNESNYFIEDDVAPVNQQASLLDIETDESVGGARRLNPHIRITNAQRNQVAIANYAGRGTDTDIIVASAKSFLSALNRMVAAEA